MCTCSTEYQDFASAVCTGLCMYMEDESYINCFDYCYYSHWGAYTFLFLCSFHGLRFAIHYFSTFAGKMHGDSWKRSKSWSGGTRASDTLPVLLVSFQFVCLPEPPWPCPVVHQEQFSTAKTHTTVLFLKVFTWKGNCLEGLIISMLESFWLHQASKWFFCWIATRMSRSTPKCICFVKSEALFFKNTCWSKVRWADVFLGLRRKFSVIEQTMGVRTHQAWGTNVSWKSYVALFISCISGLLHSSCVVPFRAQRPASLHVLPLQSCFVASA